MGPEIGGRMWWTKGRWTVETDNRFTAGFNRQNFRMQGQLGEFLNPPGGIGAPWALGPGGWVVGFDALPEALPVERRRIVGAVCFLYLA